MGPQEAIPSSRVKVFVIPQREDGGRIPLLIALVEDLNVDKDIASENFLTLGTGVVLDNVENIEQGRVRWGKVHQLDPEYHRTVLPQIAKWTEHKPFDLLGVDPDTNAFIFLAVGVRPQVDSLVARGGSAVREQFSGICRYVARGEEIGKAAA